MKTRQQIDGLRAAGRIVAETYETLRPHVVPGITTGELDAIAERYIRSQSALPVYKGYGAMRDRRGKLVRPPFPATICVAVNDVICHGIPNPKQVLREGDIIGIDIGAAYKGWVGDSCVTFTVGKVDRESQKLVDTAYRAMELGLAQALPGRRLGDIGAAIQKYAEEQGFSVVREYGGHGVGHSLHEDPFVPHYGDPHTGLRLEPGMVFTVEPMLNTGGPQTRLGPDQWAVSTADGSCSAQFEHTVAITEDGQEILTLP
jgi:methionyl aminopeptidase